MPGANFQKVAKDHVQTITRFAESPFAFTKAQMDRGKDRQCFVSTLLRQGEDEEIVKWSAAAMYGGAGDTVCSNGTHMYIHLLIHTKQTTAILEGFFLAMMLFPDVQRKAQAEMDELFGKPALPSATDRERLPYVNAIVKEATRWLTVVPLGIPHRTDQDDIINGYLIPKNAIIVPNTWYYHSYIPMSHICCANVYLGHSTMTRRYIPIPGISNPNGSFPNQVLLSRET